MFYDWVKPQGASMVRMLLIGPGAGGADGSTATAGVGGGSGAITQWIGPAMFVPDVLRIRVGLGGTSQAQSGTTVVAYQQKNTNGYSLLTANGGSPTPPTAGTAMTANAFASSGIFKSTAGQAGAAINTDITASTTTFLSGGAGGGSVSYGGRVNSKYGYPRVEGVAGGASGLDGDSGWFLTQPIMFGTGGNGGGYNTGGIGGTGGNGGIGCGGGGGGRGSTFGGTGGNGGGGAVFIWSW
jgi:hypothetical protein